MTAVSVSCMCCQCRCPQGSCSSADWACQPLQAGRDDAVRVTAVSDETEGGFADFQSAFSSNPAQVGY